MRSWLLQRCRKVIHLLGLMRTPALGLEILFPFWIELTALVNCKPLVGQLTNLMLQSVRLLKAIKLALCVFDQWPTISSYRLTLSFEKAGQFTAHHNFALAAGPMLTCC